MTCIKLDADEVPADAPCSHKRGPGAAEGIENKATRLAKNGDQRFERLDGLLGGMEPVARNACECAGYPGHGQRGSGVSAEAPRTRARKA